MNFNDVPAGDNVPEEINVVVEIPNGSNNKYEVDEETGAIFLDRTLYGPQVFPFEYGFMPKTSS
ncbi:inorganic diphosphatase, partial [Candidatus Gribaldobacteria bacterium]|nr:inorganic diphosphatase [Candidatus Gribaldobacteria bacterium]